LAYPFKVVTAAQAVQMALVMMQVVAAVVRLQRVEVIAPEQAVMVVRV
jgi:hypothetical protein